MVFLKLYLHNNKNHELQKVKTHILLMDVKCCYRYQL